IVVKPLSRQFKGISEYAGATIMGDGKVALILDVMGLAHAAGIIGELRERSVTEVGTIADCVAGNQETLLIVAVDGHHRFALPTSMISRLEKIPRSNIEVAGRREVIQYRGDILPLVRLDRITGCESDSADADELQVVVYADEHQSYGLVVSRIVDIVEAEVKCSAPVDDAPWLCGTTVIQQRVTDLLDLKLLSRMT
ncbi:MAG: chemotaxis protein CheW, partial [Pirellulaceae bacterium]